VKEAFFETLVPLLSGAPLADYLGIEMGYRYSDYRFSGGADNWKFGLDWSPTASLRVRAMAQRATRAPNIDELFREPAAQLTTLFLGEDRCSASADPVGNGLGDLCIAQGIPPDQVGVYEATQNFPITVFEGGGNTGLQPEEADTLTAGIVFQPEGLPGLSVSVDYYDIEIDNAIGAISFSNALDLCFTSNDPSSPFCEPVVRGATGDIVEYTNPQFNVAGRTAEGVDVAVDYRFELGEGFALFDREASLSLKVLANYAIENGLQTTPTSTYLDCAGYYAGACTFGFDLATVIPEYRASTRFTYDSGPLTLALNWQWVGGLDNHLDITCRDFPQACYPSELGDIGSRHYFELSGRYLLGENIELFGGVSNLFEEDPPQMGFGATQSNTAPQVYDVFGRRFFLGFRYRL
jgi:outer membrane receptor protein involved in Fe transport